MASKRVVLSNVLPDIPDASLIPLLHNFGKPTSQLSQLSISTAHADLKHIKSFRRMVYMIIPDMKKIPSTINVYHEGINYLIYVTCDDSTCAKCHKPGHTTQHCHTNAQARLGPVTYADLTAGRRVTNPPPQTSVHTLLDANTRKETTTSDNTSTFPLLIQPRQRLQPMENMNTTTKMQHKDHVPLTSKPQAQQTPKQVDDLKQHTEHHQAPVGMDDAKPEPCTLRPTPPTIEPKKTN
jgi:hypothetical protein